MIVLESKIGLERNINLIKKNLKEYEEIITELIKHLERGQEEEIITDLFIFNNLKNTTKKALEELTEKLQVKQEEENGNN